MGTNPAPASSGMRPTSRSGYGAAGAGGARPGTGQRPPGSAAAGGGAARLGTGRLGTGRLGTGMQPNYSGVGMTTDVQVADRPVTQQGMMGMRVKTAGPGRQVQDLSYYHNLLRQRVADLQKEIGRMREEGEQRQRDAAAHAQLDRRFNSLIKEVRGLEGELADYNLAKDKARNGTDPSEMMAFHEMLRRRNEAEAANIDRLFLERQERERGIARLEEQTRELQEQAEKRLQSLSPERLREYQGIIAENRETSARIRATQQELEALHAQVSQAEAALRADRYRDEFAALERRLAAVVRERNGLREEVDDARLEPDVARRKLISKVTAHSERIRELDAEAEATRAEIARKRGLVAELDADISQRESGQDTSAKYEVLFQRDQEMTVFLDSAPDARATEEAEQARLRETIVALLEHVSEGMERERVMPTREEAGAMRADLQDKERELNDSKTTKERLESELRQRHTEFEKIARLDEKITGEISGLREDITRMCDDIAQMRDLDGLRRAAEATVEELESRQEEYRARRDGFQGMLRAASVEHDRKRAMLESHPQARELLAAEEKMRNYEQAMFETRQFIETKGRDIEYQEMKQDCLQFAAEVNRETQEAQKRMPSAGLAAGV